MHCKYILERIMMHVLHDAYMVHSNSSDITVSDYNEPYYYSSKIFNDFSRFFPLATTFFHQFQIPQVFRVSKMGGHHVCNIFFNTSKWPVHCTTCDYSAVFSDTHYTY